MAQDVDRDGLSDTFEQTLLETYRPWLYFDSAETHWPCSATWFVQHSTLIHNPCGDISQSDLEANPRQILETGIWGNGYRKSNLKLNLDDAFRHGQFAENPQQSINLPFYGHAVPLSKKTATSSLSFGDHKFENGWIALQYWYLFAFNDTTKWDFFCGLFDPGDHEGDWVWVDVLVETTNNLPQYVVFHHHGDETLKSWQETERHPLGGAPIVYLEDGTHEFLWYAGDEAFWPNDPTHQHYGDGLRYRPNVLNLGEAGHPMKQATPEAQLDVELALLFNGEWGDFTGSSCFFGPDVTNPSGPVNQDFPIPPSTERLKIFDLGPSVMINQLTGINNRGQVIGHLCNGRSFVWSEQYKAYSQLFAPPYVCDAIASTISEEGAIGGTYYCYLGLHQPVIWSDTGPANVVQIFTQTNPCCPPVWTDANGIGITDLHNTLSGRIGIGRGQYGTTYRVQGNRLYLQEFVPPLSGSSTPVFSRGNASGTLIGGMNRDGWGLAVSANQANQVTVLSPPTGVHAGAYSINNLGNIVGAEGENSILWKHDGTKTLLWQNGSPVWINNRDQILGQTFGELILWQNGSITRVQDLLGANSEWRMEAPNGAINDNGWIIGQARNTSGVRHAVVIVLPPFIESIANSSVFLGNDGLLSANVTSAGLPSFQWRRNGTNLVDDGRITGAQAETLMVRSAKSNDAGAYELIVSNQFGSASTVFQMIVQLPPVVIQRLASGILLDWSASGSVLEHATNPTGPWSRISGAVSPIIINPTNAAGFFRTSATQ